MSVSEDCSSSIISSSSSYGYFLSSFCLGFFGCFFCGFKFWYCLEEVCIC